jgi:hypothetical protein
MPFVPTSDERGGADIVMVAFDPAPPVDCDKVTPPMPAKTAFPVEIVPVEPRVFPPVETPALTPPPPAPVPAFPIKEIVADPAFVEPDSVMLFEPTKTRRFDTVPVDPAVFPTLDMPPDINETLVEFGADTMNELLLNPTDITPAPTIDRLPAFTVDEEVPSVLDDP